MVVRRRRRPLWVRVFDPQYQEFYYYHKSTGQWTWEEPVEFVKTHEDPLMRAVVRVQCRIRLYVSLLKMKRRKREMLHYYLRVLDTTSKKEIDKLSALGIWLKIWDARAEKFYFYHTLSRKWTWIEPYFSVPGSSDVVMRAILKIQGSFRMSRAKRRVTHLWLKKRQLTQDKCNMVLARKLKMLRDTTLSDTMRERKGMTIEDMQSRQNRTLHVLAMLANEAQRYVQKQNEIRLMNREDSHGMILRTKQEKYRTLWKRSIKQIIKQNLEAHVMDQLYSYEKRLEDQKRRKDLDFIYQALMMDVTKEDRTDMDNPIQVGLPLLRRVSSQRRKYQKPRRSKMILHKSSARRYVLS